VDDTTPPKRRKGLAGNADGIISTQEAPPSDEEDVEDLVFLFSNEESENKNKYQDRDVVVR
jgi:hypothetical protein